MPFTQAQVIQAMKAAGWNPATRTNLAGDVRNANLHGLGIFKAQSGRMGAGPTPPLTPAAPTPDSITQSFLDQLKPLFATDKPAITPFEQSGFYSEADSRGAADSEYDPFYAKERAFTDQTNAFDERQQAMQRATDDKSRLEAVNASGGYRSSAYGTEQADTTSLRTGQDELRRQALLRAGERSQNEQRGQKEQFTLNRRNEGYNRYLQSIGALTT